MGRVRKEAVEVICPRKMLNLGCASTLRSQEGLCLKGLGLISMELLREIGEGAGEESN